MDSYFNKLVDGLCYLLRSYQNIKSYRFEQNISITKYFNRTQVFEMANHIIETRFEWLLKNRYLQFRLEFSIFLNLSSSKSLKHEISYSLKCLQRGFLFNFIIDLNGLLMGFIYNIIAMGWKVVFISAQT